VGARLFSITIVDLDLEICLQVSYLCYNPTDSGAVTLTQSVIDNTLGGF
jgi:hypothetical protein